jgi:ribosomal protein L34E
VSGMQAPPAAAAPLPDRCPRCGQAFHCGVQDAAPCACSRLQLTTQQLAALRAAYSTCLCMACLQAVAAGEAVAEGSRIVAR